MHKWDQHTFGKKYDHGAYDNHVVISIYNIYIYQIKDQNYESKSTSIDTSGTCSYLY